ncbi:hypothetical protein [Jiella pelagia]|uniref:hypothetical protein n=1 Tax=Jiella pelagia TaxID=2986949 RepID=UPI0038B2A1E9
MAQATKLSKVSCIASTSGSAPVKRLEGANRLEQRHAGAGEDAASLGSRAGQKRGLERKIDDVRHPVARSDEFERDRHARQLGHADRRGIDDAVGEGRGLSKRGNPLRAARAIHP